jgi:hypothetical protein
MPGRVKKNLPAGKFFDRSLCLNANPPRGINMGGFFTMQELKQRGEFRLCAVAVLFIDRVDDSFNRILRIGKNPYGFRLQRDHGNMQQRFDPLQIIVGKIFFVLYFECPCLSGTVVIHCVLPEC